MQAPLIPGTFPLGYCYPYDPQQLIADAFSLAHAEVPTNIQGVAYGETAPDPTVTRLFYSSNFNRLYEFREGLWMSKYSPDANEDIKWIVEMTEAEIKAWDNPGGAVAVLGAEDHTGPFWEIDHNYDGRIPIGVGTLPLSTIAVQLGINGGFDQMEITADNLPKHRHNINIGPESGNSSYLTPLATSENGTFKVNGAEQIRFYDLPSTEVGRTRENESLLKKLDIMPPYRGVHVVQRTARIWHTL